MIRAKTQVLLSARCHPGCPGSKGEHSLNRQAPWSSESRTGWFSQRSTHTEPSTRQDGRRPEHSLAGSASGSGKGAQGQKKGLRPPRPASPPHPEHSRAPTVPTWPPTLRTVSLSHRGHSDTVKVLFFHLWFVCISLALTRLMALVGCLDLLHGEVFTPPACF